MLPIERHVAAGAVDNRDELPASQLHELVDAGARPIERLDDRAIAQLLFDGREQPIDLDFLEPPLGSARDNLRQPRR